MTEDTQKSTENPNEIPKEPATNDLNIEESSEIAKLNNGRREKSRLMTKVIIRRLPPTMTQEQFLEQVSPLPENDYIHFSKADSTLGQYAFSRAYINFLDQQDIFVFREKFDNYVFVDSKGTEYPAVVEFAPFQRIPKRRTIKKKDLKCGTIESDPYYINFVESLKNQDTDPNNTQPKTEYSYQPSDHTPKKITSTPLLDFLKQRKQEKQRIKDEKREDKRRRDIERKKNKEDVTLAKQFSKTEDLDKNVTEKDLSKENKENKEEKDKNFSKNMKHKIKKDDRYTRDKGGLERDIKIPSKSNKDFEEHDTKYNKKYDNKKIFKKEEAYKERNELFRKPGKFEEKRGKSYEKMRLEKKRLAESQKKQNVESIQSKTDDTSDNKSRECQDVKEIESKGQENSGKNFTDITEQDSKVSNEKPSKSKTKSVGDDDYTVSSESFDNFKKQGSSEYLADQPEIPVKKIVKRRSSLESGGENGTAITMGNSNSGCLGNNNRDSNDVDGSLRRHKSLDGESGNKLQKSEDDKGKDKDKKDPRLERRIRNKDRPAMEIYRPGMGRFSKQRIEREKGNDDKVTPSQSPTRASASSKGGKSEVRSMMFKRSVSRDFA